MFIYGGNDIYKIDGKRVFLKEKLVFEADVENITQHGSLLVIKHDGKYDLYLPSYCKLCCIFNDVVEYQYKKGLLFINQDSRYWTMISTYDFAIGLTEEKLESKKSKLPKIFIFEQGELHIINVENGSALFNVEDKGYILYGTQSSKKMYVKEVGKLEILPIAYRFKLIKKCTECLINFWGGTEFGEFAKIEEFATDDYPMLDGYYGYWGKDQNDNICGLFIGRDKNHSGCDYSITFKLPVQKIVFCNRYILNKECTSAMDVWKVTTDKKEHFIFQTIGKLDSKAIQFNIPKEDLFNC